MQLYLSLILVENPAAYRRLLSLAAQAENN